jgi:transcriptional regulator with XRE-family HTH domain
MTYGQIIKSRREQLGWSQRELGDAIGCTDGYVALIERQTKIPSVSLCLAMAGAFQLSNEEREDLLKAIESARVERSRTHIRTRGAAVRGALRGPGDARPEEVTPGHGGEVLSVEQIARDFSADPRLRTAYQDLKIAFSDPHLRTTVLNTLRALAAQASLKSS